MAPSEASDKGVGNGTSWLFYVPHVFTTHTHTQVTHNASSVSNFYSGLMGRAIHFNTTKELPVLPEWPLSSVFADSDPKC